MGWITCDNASNNDSVINVLTTVDKGAWKWMRIYVIWDRQPQYTNTQTQHTTRTLKVVQVSWKV